VVNFGGAIKAIGKIAGNARGQLGLGTRCAKRSQRRRPKRSRPASRWLPSLAGRADRPSRWDFDVRAKEKKVIASSIVFVYDLLHHEFVID
jgi:hypothetical protein